MRRRNRLRRFARLVFVSAREVATSLEDALESISAQMDAYDQGVDTSVLRAEDFRGTSKPVSKREPEVHGGPFGRTGPMDDDAPMWQ